MNHQTKQFFHISFMIWTILLGVWTFFRSFLVSPLIVAANVPILVWMCVVYLGADNTYSKLMFLLRLEHLFGSFYFLVSITVAILDLKMNFFESNGHKVVFAFWSNCLGLMIHLALFALSRPNHRINDDAPEPLVTYQAGIDI